jgi:hypothetical protein
MALRYGRLVCASESCGTVFASINDFVLAKMPDEKQDVLDVQVM